jgi:hypothetical protein
MVQKILTAEELDVMIATEPKTELGHEESMKRVNDSLRELRNQRSRVKTLEDALDAYDGLVARAYKTRALGVDGQTSTLQAIGRAGTGNSQWNYPGDFSWAVWLIVDHEGEQTQRNSVLNAEYGMSLEDDYKPLLKSHNATLAVLRKEQADTKLQAQMEQARRNYENDLGNIEGDD